MTTENEMIKVVSDLKLVHASALSYNNWNPNVQDDFTFQKEQESIRRYGFLDPITVVERHDLTYLIIDGQHRCEAGKRLGMTLFPCMVIGTEDSVPLHDQRALTILLNELKGTADPEKMARLVDEIHRMKPPDDTIVLPFTAQAQMDYISLAESLVRPMDSGPVRPPDDTDAPESERTRRDPVRGEPWQTWNISMPASVAQTVRDVFDRLKERSEIEEDYQCLLRLAEQYTSG